MKNPQFTELYENMRNFNLEKFVCSFYGYPKETSVNIFRTLKKKSFYLEHKPIDLCNISPSVDNLRLHSKRSNYVSAIYQRAGQLIMGLDDPVNHGWNEEGDSIWSSKSFPEDIADLLLNYNRGSKEDEQDLQCDEEDEDIPDTHNSDEAVGNR